MTVYVDKNYVMVDDELKTKVVTRLIAESYISYSKIIQTAFDSVVTVDKKNIENAIDRVSLINRNSKRYCVKFDIKEGVMTLSAESEDGTVNEKVPVSLKGKDLTAGFNSKYIMDCLKAIDDEYITMNFTSSTAPHHKRAGRELAVPHSAAARNSLKKKKTKKRREKLVSRLFFCLKRGKAKCDERKYIKRKTNSTEKQTYNQRSLILRRSDAPLTQTCKGGATASCKSRRAPRPRKLDETLSRHGRSARRVAFLRPRGFFSELCSLLDYVSACIKIFSKGRKDGPA